MDRKLFLWPVSVAVFFAFGKMNAQNSNGLIQNYYQKSGQIAQKNGGAGVIILSEDASKSLGVNVVNVQQTFAGLRVYNALGKVMIKEDKIISEKNDFKKDITVASQKKAKESFPEDL